MEWSENVGQLTSKEKTTYLVRFISYKNVLECKDLKFQSSDLVQKEKGYTTFQKLMEGILIILFMIYC